jgi:hypothetical protein
MGDGLDLCTGKVAERMNSPQRPHEVRLRGPSVTGQCHATGPGTLVGSAVVSAQADSVKL